MPKFSALTIAGLLCIVVGGVYLLVASTPTSNHAQTLLQIALKQPFAYAQIAAGVIIGTFIGAMIGRMSTRWPVRVKEHRQVAVSAGLLIIVCLLFFSSGRATIEPLLRGGEPVILLYLLPFSIACVASACLVSGIIYLFRRSA